MRTALFTPLAKFAVRLAALALAVPLLAACASGPGDPALSRPVPCAMATTLTPAANPQFPTSLSCPADGDACNAASVNGAYQKVLDAADAARLMSQVARQPVRAYSVNGTHVVVSPIPFFTVTVSSVWTALSMSLTTLDVAAKYGAALANSTRYYIYAGWIAGVVDIEVSTTAPDSSVLFKSGGTDRWYVTTLLTDSGGIIIPFTQEGQRYTHLGWTNTPQRVLNAVTTLTTWTDISGGVNWPSWATSVRLTLWVAVAEADILFRPKSITATGYTTGQSTGAHSITTSSSLESWVPMYPGATMQFYLFSVGAPQFSAWVTGWSY